MGALDDGDADLEIRRADLVTVLLANIAREYPSQVLHHADGPGELGGPRDRHPVFHGCFDWHSAVHSHWALVRLARDRVLAPRVVPAVAARFSPAAIAGELAYVAPRPRFELPYGLAWLWRLDAELVAGGAEWAATHGALAPLVGLARDRLVAWARALPAPIRSGEHACSAFAIGLAIDAARATGDGDAAAALAAIARAHHAADRDAPWAYEPSGYDFLSPALAVAALMARVLGDELAGWLDGFAPSLGRGLRLVPPVAADRADGKLVHWDGLALSRAWMLAELAAALPAGDERVPALAGAARAHLARGAAALAGATYAGGHWLPSFAIYADDAVAALGA